MERQPPTPPLPPPPSPLLSPPPPLGLILRLWSLKNLRKKTKKERKRVSFCLSFSSYLISVDDLSLSFFFFFLWIKEPRKEEMFDLRSTRQFIVFNLIKSELKPGSYFSKSVSNPNWIWTASSGGWVKLKLLHLPMLFELKLLLTCAGCWQSELLIIGGVK